MRNDTKDTRIAILDQAERLLIERGYKKMTIEAIAQRVGIGKGSVYLHFASKEEVALSHIDRIIDRLKFRLREIAAGSGDIDARLEDMLIERVDARLRSVKEYSTSLSDLLAAVRQGLLERRKRYFREEGKLFADVIRSGVETGVYSKSIDADTAAASFIVATNSLLPLSLSPAEIGSESEIIEAVRSVARLLIAGLKFGTK